MSHRSLHALEALYIRECNIYLRRSGKIQSCHDDLAPFPEIAILYAHMRMVHSLMSLPDEIKLRIVEFVDVNTLNTHQMLRQTHPWFKENISVNQLADSLQAIEKYRLPLSANHLICHTCLKFLLRDQFADTPRGIHRSRRAVRPHERFCLACGIKHAKYPPGSQIQVDGKSMTVCEECRKLFRTRDHLADKLSCRNSSDVQRFSRNRDLCKQCGI